MSETGSTEHVDRAHDRLALRQLVETYAHAADRRLSEVSGSLFTDDGLLAIYDGDPEGQEPNRTRRGPEQIARAMVSLDRYAVTTHFLGQQTVEFDAADPHVASGETYCLAHHVTKTDEGRRMYVMSIRYLDRYRRVDGIWKFEERRLAVDWTDDRPLM
ncbi:MAG TPA: nuclear transport factor 2 family protein [Acidimicrobiia bacterium]|nr:nuclear transport factor 2 family protein [Acidimicrobiia bacterium]